MSEHSMRVRILGDASGAQSAFQTVEKAAELSARKIEGSFHHVGSLIKKTIGVTALGVGIEQAVESASHLVNLQKVQAKILDNAGIAARYQLTTSGEQVKNAEDATRWYSKILDQQATHLSLTQGIAKASIVQSQTLLLQNADIRKLYDGNINRLEEMTLAAANLSEVMGGGGRGIVGSARMLGRLMADPEKSMSVMRRYGVTLSKAQQEYIKQQQSMSLEKGQLAALKVLKDELGGVARAAASPVELLKNLYQNVMTSLGLGLIPIFENLAQALIPPVQALLPVLEFMGTTIKDVAEKLGKSLGNIIADLTPLFALMTNSVIPALLDIVTPLIQMVDVALKPIVKVFSDMVGTADHLGPLGKLIKDMGEQTAKNLQPAIDSIGKTFAEMARSGALKDLFMAMLDALSALAPIMPDLATSFSEIMAAIAPIISQSGQDLAQLIRIWTKLLQALTPLITGAADVLAKLADGISRFSTPISALLAIWFTKKLFITPIMATIEALGLLGGKAVATGRTIKGAFSSMGGLFSGGVGGFNMNRTSYLQNRAGMAGAKAEQFKAWYGESDPRYLRAKANFEKYEAKMKVWEARSTFTAAQGGGIRGLTRSMLGLPYDPGTSKAPLMPYEMKKLPRWMRGDNSSPQEIMKFTMDAYNKRKEWEKLHGDGTWTYKPSEVVKATWDHKKAMDARGRFAGFREGAGRVGGFMRSGIGRGVGIGTAALGAAQIAGVLPAPGKGVGGAIGSVAEFASMGMALGPWGAAIGAAIGGIKALWDNCKPFHDFVVKIGKKLLEWGKIIWEKVKPYIVKFGQTLGDIWERMLPVIKKVGEFIKTYIVTYIHVVIAVFKTLFNIVKTIFHGIGWVVEKVMRGIKHSINFVIHIINGLIRAWNFLPGHKDVATIKTMETSKGTFKFHSGGIVPGPRGKEVPAILQAGEAVVSLGQMNRLGMGGGASLNVHPGAVVININGSADPATTAEIKRHVEAQFKELHRTLKSMGR